ARLAPSRAPPPPATTTPTPPPPPHRPLRSFPTRPTPHPTYRPYGPLATPAPAATDARPVPSVSAISPNVVDLASPPASFSITGTALANLGFGLPVVNFMRGSTMLAQVRATTLNGTTTLTVPFSSSLTVGAVQAQVYMQTGNATYSLIGTLALTVTD